MITLQAWALAVLSPCFLPVTDEVGVEDVVMRALARADAIFSASIEYRLTRALGKDGSQKVTDHCIFVFRGDSWIKRHVGHPGIRLVHRGKLVEYYETEQATGPLHRSLAISRPISAKESLPFPPIHVGTFWFDETKAYVRDRIHEARILERGADGSWVVEWTVVPEHVGSAFRGLTDIVIGKGGKLRVHVNPAFGHALTKVEFLGLNGQVMTRFTSSSWKEVSPGIFFPMASLEENFNSQEPLFWYRYEIVDVSRVNEPIEDDAFVINVPEGTTVADSRSGTGATIFRVTQQNDLAAHGLLDIVSPQEQRVWWKAAGMMLIGLLLALVLLLILRCLRRPRATCG